MNPVLVRYLFLPLHERLKRKPTLEFLKALERTQWLEPQDLQELQFTRLIRLLKFAYAHVPYYRRLLDEQGLPPSRIQSIQDFQKIPPLTKADIRASFGSLRARTRLSRVTPISTGGSTGSPVTVLVDMQRLGMGEAARLRAHRWFGIEPGAREIVLWGSPIELKRQDRLRSVRDWLVNSKLLSAFDMSEQSLSRYAAAIQRFLPQKMYGYASAFYLLARYLGDTQWRPTPGLRAVFTTAEPLFDFQRKAIQAVFGCPVAIEYGARDAGFVAHECPKGGLHTFAEGMLVEIPEQRSDGTGEIVVTNLDALAMPMIRYRTGDIGSLESSPCPCGRTLPRLKAVEGRQTDFIVTPRGRVLHALSIIYILREVSSIREFRVIQDALDHLILQVVAEPSFSDGQREKLVEQLRLRLGNDVKVDVTLLPAIPRAPSGKFRYVESKVAEQYLSSLLKSAG